MAVLLLSLPSDLLRVTFSFLEDTDLYLGDIAFLAHQESSSYYHTALRGHVLANFHDFPDDCSREIHCEPFRIPYSDLYSWILERHLVFRSIEFHRFHEESLLLLQRSRHTLTSLTFHEECEIQQLEGIGNCPGLTTIYILDCKITNPDTFVDFLSHQPQLVELLLSPANSLPISTLRILTSCCPKIKRLTLQGSWVDDDSVRLLTDGCRNLKSLHIVDTAVRNEETIHLLMDTFPKLSALNISNAPLAIQLQMLKRIIIPSLMSSEEESQEEAIAWIQTWFHLLNGNGAHDPGIVDILLDFLCRNPQNWKCLLPNRYCRGLQILSRFFESNPEMITSTNIFPKISQHYQAFPTTMIEMWSILRGSLPHAQLQELKSIISTLDSWEHATDEHQDIVLHRLFIYTALLESPRTKNLVNLTKILTFLISEIDKFNHVGRSLYQCVFNFAEQHRALLIESNLIPVLMARRHSPCAACEFTGFLMKCRQTRDQVLVNYLLHCGVVEWAIRLLPRHYLVKFCKDLMMIVGD